MGLWPFTTTQGVTLRFTAARSVEMNLQGHMTTLRAAGTVASRLPIIRCLEPKAWQQMTGLNMLTDHCFISSAQGAHPEQDMFAASLITAHLAVQASLLKCS